jgi:hypothetical protein
MACTGKNLLVLCSRNDHSIINEMVYTPHSLAHRLWRYSLFQKTLGNRINEIFCYGESEELQQEI